MKRKTYSKKYVDDLKTRIRRLENERERDAAPEEWLSKKETQETIADAVQGLGKQLGALGVQNQLLQHLADLRGHLVAAYRDRNPTMQKRIGKMVAEVEKLLKNTEKKAEESP